MSDRAFAKCGSQARIRFLGSKCDVAVSASETVMHVPARSLVALTDFFGNEIRILGKVNSCSPETKGTKNR